MGALVSRFISLRRLRHELEVSERNADRARMQERLMLSALARERQMHSEHGARPLLYSDPTAVAGTSGTSGACSGGIASPADTSGHGVYGHVAAAGDARDMHAAFALHDANAARPPSRTMLSSNSPSVTMVSTTPSEVGVPPTHPQLLPAGLLSAGDTAAPPAHVLPVQPTVSLQDLLLAPPHLQAESLLSGEGTTRCSESNHGDLA